MTAPHCTLVRVALAAAALGGAWPCVLPAQATGGPYTLRESVISAAGARVEAAPYSATVTAGQPTALTAAAGRFRLVGGFHQPAAKPLPLFRDGFENPAPVTSTTAGLPTSQGKSP